jgi:hypothetical protein
MKFLAGENLPWLAVSALREDGFEAAWLTDWAYCAPYRDYRA